MVQILKTVFLAGAFLTQLSFSAVIQRHGGRHYHSHVSHGAASNYLTSSVQLLIPTTTTPAVSNTNDASLPTSSPTVSSVLDSDSDSDAVDSEDVDSGDSTDSSDDSTDSSDDESTDAATTPATTIILSVSTATSQADTATQIQAGATSTTAKTSATQAAGTFWQPAAGSTWQIELSGIVSDTSYPADVFDLDLFDVPQDTVDALHAAGKKVICYFSAGSFENWRSDAADFEAADKGSAMEGWEGEWWLDTRTANVRSIMTTRIALAKSKGCDGVDPDNVDGYANNNGVGLTAADGVDYLDFLADAAHEQGLSIGLKNAGDLVDSVLAKMQWHVNEQCLEFDECNLFKPFIDAGKPVFHIEYPETAPTISASVKSEKCVAATSIGFSTVLKTESLNAWIETC